MRITRFSQGGQIQVPAEVRRRWGTRDVIVDDEGTMLTIRLLPDDPHRRRGRVPCQLRADERRDATPVA